MQKFGNKPVEMECPNCHHKTIVWRDAEGRAKWVCPQMQSNNGIKSNEPQTRSNGHLRTRRRSFSTVRKIAIKYIRCNRTLVGLK